MPVMFDSITPSNLPGGGDAYLGYPDGRWPDYLAIAAAHGNVPVFALSVFGTVGVGGGVDYEPGDASLLQAAEYISAERAYVSRPLGYCDWEHAPGLVAAVTEQGVPRNQWRLLVAHWGAGAHICGPTTCKLAVQADGTQWLNAPGYDQSEVSADFLHANPHPGPTAPPAPIVVVPKEIEMVVLQSHSLGSAVFDGTHKVALVSVADAEAFLAAGLPNVQVSDAQFSVIPFA